MRSWVMEKGNTSQTKLEELSKDFVTFNEQIGLPIHPITKQRSPLTDYQLEIYETLLNISKLFIVKSKKIGISDILLRIALYHSIHTWSNGEVMLIPGSREIHSKSLLARINTLCNAPILRPYIKKRNERYILLTNNMIVRQYPSNYQALVGRPNVYFILYDECAYSDSEDDTPMYQAAISNLAQTLGVGKIVLCSSLNGARGFFWNLVDNPPQGWTKLQYDYTYGLRAGILSQEFINQARIDESLNFPQNYECKVDVGGYSALGDINTVKDSEITFEEEIVKNA